MEVTLNEKAEKIYELQKQIDELLCEIYEEDELFGEKVFTVLKEELF